MFSFEAGPVEWDLKDGWSAVEDKLILPKGSLDYLFSLSSHLNFMIWMKQNNNVTLKA